MGRARAVRQVAHDESGGWSPRAVVHLSRVTVGEQGWAKAAANEAGDASTQDQILPPSLRTTSLFVLTLMAAQLSALPAPAGSLVAAVAAAGDTEPPVITDLFVQDDTLEETAEAIVTIAADESETGGNDIAELELSFDDRVVFRGNPGSPYLRNTVQATYWRSIGTGSGERSVCARVADSVGNWSVPTCLTVTVAPGAAPVLRDVAVTPDVVGLGEPFTVTGVADDTATGDSAVDESLINVNGVCCTGGGWFGEEASYLEFSETLQGVAQPGEAEVCVIAYDALNNASEEVCVPLLVVDDRAPELSTLDADQVEYAEGEVVNLTATASDARRGGATIASVELTVDGDPAGSMQAADGSLDEVEEDLVAVITDLAVGTHEICAVATDAVGNPTAPSCDTVRMVETTPPTVRDIVVVGTPAAGELVEVRAVVDDRATGGSTIIGGRLLDADGQLLGLLTAVDGAFDGPVEEVRATTRFWQVGTHVVCLRASDRHATTGSGNCVEVEVIARRAEGSGTVTSALSPLVAEARFAFDLREGPTGTPTGWTGSLSFEDGPVTFVADDLAQVFLDDDTAVVAGTGTRNGVEQCSFTAGLTEGDVAAGGTPAFDLHLRCTAGDLTGGLSDYRTADPTLLSGRIDVRGVTP